MLRVRFEWLLTELATVTTVANASDEVNGRSLENAIRGAMALKMSGSETVKAILTDVQFWIPAAILAGGIVLLVILH